MKLVIDPHCLNGTLSCVDFRDVIMGDIPIYNLTTLCLNGTLPCVAFMDVIVGDIAKMNPHIKIKNLKK